MGIMTDFVNKDLTAALKLVATTYTTMTVEMSSCGYGCSDHASWTRGKNY